MTATTTDGFLDGALIRLISLALAILIGWVLWSGWGPEIRAAFEGTPVTTVVEKTPAAEANPALDACLETRVGQVDNMKAEGILSDAQYEAFRARAIELCTAQNPAVQ
jgi:hypothetical protein